MLTIYVYIQLYTYVLLLYYKDMHKGVYLKLYYSVLFTFLLHKCY